MHFSNTLPRQIKDARAKVDTTWHEMQTLLEKLQMSPAELQEHADSMHRYYSTPAEEAPNSVYYDDEICEVLMCQEILTEHIENLLHGGPFPAPGSWKRLQEFLAARVNGRIPTNEQLPSTLDEKLKMLFNRSGCTMRDWKNEDNSFTDHYIKARDRYIFRKLRLKKSEMFEVWYKCICELEALRGSSVGTHGNTPGSCDYFDFEEPKNQEHNCKTLGTVVRNFSSL